MKNLFILMLLFMPFIGFASIDSVGVEQIEGKKYIIHRVEKGEGLYGIARIYGTTAAVIQQVNNLSSTILELGQLLKVPAKNQKVSVTNNTNKTEKADKPKTEPIVQNPKLKLEQYATHVVKKGETLYKIATKYNISVTELKDINHLTSNTLSYNQKLKVPKQGRIIENPDIIEPSEEDEKVDKVEVTKGTADAKVSTRDNKYLNSTDFNETGIAGWINDKNINGKKSIALHKTAPIGTIIRVTNLMNNKSVYVKVIGTLPETGDNENTIIVLSKAAVNMLGVIDQKFRVSLNYSIPKE
jgi:LysM repeat protein